MNFGIATFGTRVLIFAQRLTVERVAYALEPRRSKNRKKSTVCLKYKSLGWAAVDFYAESLYAFRCAYNM